MKNKWCEKFDVEMIEWNMILLWKETEDIIVTAQKMMRECLLCTKKEWCEDSWRLVVELDKYNE